MRGDRAASRGVPPQREIARALCMGSRVPNFRPAPRTGRRSGSPLSPCAPSSGTSSQRHAQRHALASNCELTHGARESARVPRDLAAGDSYSGIFIQGLTATTEPAKVSERARPTAWASGCRARGHRLTPRGLANRQHFPGDQHSRARARLRPVVCRARCWQVLLPHCQIPCPACAHQAQQPPAGLEPAQLRP